MKNVKYYHEEKANGSFSEITTHPPTKWLKLKRPSVPSVGKDVEQLHVHSGWNYKAVPPLWETVWQLPVQSNLDLPRGQEAPCLGFPQRKVKCVSTHRPVKERWFIHDSPTLGTAHVLLSAGVCELRVITPPGDCSLQ